MNKDKESLDSKINRYREEYKRKASSSSSDGTEQFTELVEKYKPYTFDDDERWFYPRPCLSRYSGLDLYKI